MWVYIFFVIDFMVNKGDTYKQKEITLTQPPESATGLTYKQKEITLTQPPESATGLMYKQKEITLTQAPESATGVMFCVKLNAYSIREHVNA